MVPRPCATSWDGRLFLKSQGEIEAAVCQGMARFQQQFMGRGPQDIRAHLIGDLLLVRLQGILTHGEPGRNYA